VFKQKKEAVPAAASENAWFSLQWSYKRILKNIIV
jgi:hypothetical protein